ncbi:MAG TPA: EamA family transporter [Casimicrobiaceae bacterium]|nr:EamA family transporter [Casimicrobiaceae bacterium]
MNRAIAYALASAVLFGVSTPLAKLLLGEAAPLMLAGLLYASSGVGLLVFAAARAIRSPTIVVAEARDWRWLIGAFAFGGVLGPIALLVGLARTGASTASLLLNLEGVLTALLAWFMFRENFDRRIVLGMAAIVAGGLALVWVPTTLPTSPLGIALIVGACFCWALDNNLTRKASGGDAVAIAALKGVIAGTINLALALGFGNHFPRFAMLATAAGVGFFSYGVSLVLYVLALRHLGAARSAAYFSVAPFFGAVLGVTLGQEVVSSRLILAGTLMAFGAWLHVSERHSHLHGHDALRHTHSHVHDEHHRHAHDFEWDGREPHTHFHEHEPIMHMHPHYPDLHHRHRH